MTVYRINWQEHCPFVLNCETLDQLRACVDALLRLNPGTCFAVVGSDLQIATTERGIGAINTILFPPPPSWEQQLANVRSGGGKHRNGHDLDPIHKTVKEPCWRIEHLARIRHKLVDNPEALAEWDKVSNSDNPNGLIHDETCNSCRGSNEQTRRDIVGWRCRQCEQEFHEQHLFDASSCRQVYVHGLYAPVSLSFVRAWIEEHDDGDHDENDVSECPRCAEGRMRVEAEAARQNTPAGVG